MRRLGRWGAGSWLLAQALCARPAPAQLRPAMRDAQWYALHADSAFEQGNRAAYLRLSLQARQLAPRHPSVLYRLARAYTVNGLPGPALVLLAQAARMGDTRTVEGDTVFRALRGDAEFRRIAAAFARNRLPLIFSDTAFVLTDPDLLPDALALDPHDSSFFVGSLARHEVLRLTRSADVVDFADPGDGLLRVAALRVDAPRRVLWCATWAPGLDTARSPAARVDHTRLFRYDARTGRLLRRLTFGGSPAPHRLNDLAVTRTGDVYATDGDAGAIYRVRRDADSLELFVRPDPARFSGPRGLALDAHDQRLYVAFAAGVGIVDLRTRAVALLEVPGSITTADIDGLYRYGAALVGVQTNPAFTRVVRFDLDGSGRRVLAEHVLERAHPAYRQPTTGAVVGDWLYYIANSQWGRLAPDGRLTPDPKARGAIILRLPLAPAAAAEPSRRR
ncbi:MAG TPA: hypothetical protein VJU87_03080 [Gemmatimonadaceae bacterium]|nr:hypothetical protein [Gemmatimonadaceae bacterium]